MKRFHYTLVFFSLFLSVSLANAFQFSSPTKGEKVVAGSTIEVKVEPGDISPLFGVLLSSSPQGLIEAKLDSSMPFKWKIKIPEHFHGPLTLRAVGRRYVPIPNPPMTTITFMVVLPAISISNHHKP